MNKPDPIDKWKKEVELLRLKINEYESVIAKLKSEDSAEDIKFENLNKLHAQKIRALMNSIQDLKKQNATIRAQGKENNRSKLIEKLKTELVQQEISIQALRDIVNDNDRCDEQIIKYLNKGPPRIRPMSREEMKIQIRKLQGKLGITKVSKGDKAVDDLESMLNPSRDEEEVKIVDPMQNEKIVELVEQLQNLQLDVRAKDSTIEHLRQQTRRLNEELLNYKSMENEEKFLGYKVSGIESEKQNLIEKMNQNSSNSGELQVKLESLVIELRAKNELVNSLKKRLEEISTTRGSKDKEVEKYRKEVSQAMNALRLLEEENKRLKDHKENILEELKNRDIALEELNLKQEIFRPSKPELAESVFDYKDMEIEALQAKLEEIQKNSSLPENFMAAEKAELEKYKEKVKELYIQVAELQEEVEFLHHENLQEKKTGAAKFLSGKTPQNLQESPEVLSKIDEMIKDRAKINVELARLRAENSTLLSELKVQEKESSNLLISNKKFESELQELGQKVMEGEIHKKEVISKNREIVENLSTNYFRSFPAIQVPIPRNYISQLLLFSDNLVKTLVKK